MIVLTDRAELELVRISQESDLPTNRVRVGVKGGGCSGFSYTLGFDDSPIGETDQSFRHGSIELVCDSKSFLYLSGITVDFETSLMGRGFKFINPNAKNTCGCGESFTV